MSSIKLLALDLDGTLLDSHSRIPPANLDALQRAVDRGIEIVLATGRRYDFARSIFEQLPRPLTLILSNGAIVKSCDGRTLLRHLLPTDIARSVLAEASHHRQSAALLFDRVREGQIVYERVEWEHPIHRKFFAANRPFITEITPLEDALTEEPLQVMFTGRCAEMRSLFDRLRGVRVADLAACAAGPARADVAEVTPAAAPASVPYSVALTEYVARDFSLVDVIRAGCSKGAALREWAARRGVDRASVMAIGDNLNDLQMLEFAGRPVVMGNALDELKQRGWRVTASNDEAGVARAIDDVLR